MTLDGDGGRESRKNTRPRDYGRTLFLLREEKLRRESAGVERRPTTKEE